MSANWSTKRGLTSKKGAFIEGIWHCECNPRLPAEKFQTKNGGPHHGKWFLTCQKGKPKSCGFFLWSDDAKLREEGAVLSNSRTESRFKPVVAMPQTPKKPVFATQAPTPDTRSHKRASSSGTIDFEQEESFDWPPSDDELLAEVAAQATTGPPPLKFETPWKAAKTSGDTSPGKRTHTKMLNESTTMALQNAGDIFTTPSTSVKSTKSILGSLSPTPAHGRSQADQSGGVPEPSNLAQEALNILRKNHVALLPSVECELIDLLNKHELRTQGIVKGRAITRLAVTAREKRITELQNRVTGLEMEKETQRQVIGHLKQDMATSPAKTPYTKSPYRGRGNRKSEV